MQIDKVIINGKVYFNVEVEAPQTDQTKIETTTCGLNGWVASNAREFISGPTMSELIITIPEDQL